MLPFTVIAYCIIQYEVNVCHSCLFEKLLTITDIFPQCCLKSKTFLGESYLIAPILVTYLAYLVSVFGQQFQINCYILKTKRLLFAL